MVMRPVRRMSVPRRPRRRHTVTAGAVLLWILWTVVAISWLVALSAPRPEKDHYPNADYYCAQETSNCAPWMTPEPAP